MSESRLGEYNDVPLRLEEFAPFTYEQTRRFFQVFMNELMTITLAPEISDSQIEFINEVSSKTSGLLSHQLGEHNLALPELSTTHIMRRMPAILSGIKEATDHTGLRTTMRKSGGRFLENRESLRKVVDQMATGSIGIDPTTREPRELMEDYTVGVMHYTVALVEVNGSFVVDNVSKATLDSMLESCSKVRNSKTTPFFKYDPSALALNSIINGGRERT